MIQPYHLALKVLLQQRCSLKLEAALPDLFFSKKTKPSVKKAKKQPNPSLDKAKFINICLLTTQIKIHLVYLQHLHKKQLIQNYFFTICHL